MCLYYRGKVALLFYVDDGIFLGPTQKDIDEAVVGGPCFIDPGRSLASRVHHDG